MADRLSEIKARCERRRAAKLGSVHRAALTARQLGEDLPWAIAEIERLRIEVEILARQLQAFADGETQASSDVVYPRPKRRKQ